MKQEMSQLVKDIIKGYILAAFSEDIEDKRNKHWAEAIDAALTLPNSIALSNTHVFDAIYNSKGDPMLIDYSARIQHHRVRRQ